MSDLPEAPAEPEPQDGGVRVAVVMPAYQAARELELTVPAIIAAADGAPVLVVDPGSTDGSADVAERHGADVVRLGRRAGPAEARNAGVALIDADVVLFVDSDCVAHPDVVRRVREQFERDSGLVSLTGSYDDEPPDQGFFSQYMNLRHHHTHQFAQRENATFWAGCGAVRLSAFEQVGGFDADRYPMPMIEDIELGMRLRALGATRLDPDLHVTHLKRWTGWSVVRTDVLCRALPWSRLIVEAGELPNDLNLRTSQRVAAAVAPLALASVPTLPLLVVLAPVWSLIPLLLLSLSLVMSRSLIGFFAERRGVAFAIGAWLCHQVHLTYSALTFAYVRAEFAVRRSDALPVTPTADGSCV